MVNAPLLLLLSSTLTKLLPDLLASTLLLQLFEPPRLRSSLQLEVLLLPLRQQQLLAGPEGEARGPGASGWSTHEVQTATSIPNAPTSFRSQHPTDRLPDPLLLPQPLQLLLLGLPLKPVKVE